MVNARIQPSEHHHVGADTEIDRLAEAQYAGESPDQTDAYAKINKEIQ